MEEEQKKKFMGEAIRLSEKALGRTSPNPAVGTVIVKNGKIISSGFTKPPGGDHAEIAALKKAGRSAKGSTMFVTLEPCSHYGRTPPCTDSIIKSGIKLLYTAGLDPNPKERGRGVKQLRKTGIRVGVGLLSGSASIINQSYFKYIRTNIPYITIKAAISLDGKIATKLGDSKWISSVESRKYSQKLRLQNDAILVGINTIKTDNPSLTIRKPPSNKIFRRVLLDSRAIIRPDSRVLITDAHHKTIVAVTKKASKQRLKRLRKDGVNVLHVNSRNSKVDIEDLLIKLGERGVTSIIVEGGGEVIWSFLSRGFFDRIILFVAPVIIGGRVAKSFVEGEGFSLMKNVLRLKKPDVRFCGNDLVLDFFVKKY